MSEINFEGSMKNNRTIIRLESFRLIYLTVFLLYAHASGYKLLEYFKPGAGNYLKLIIGLIFFASLCITFFKILRMMKISGGIPVLLLILYVIYGVMSIVNTYMFFGTIDIKQYTTGLYKSILPITILFWSYSAVRKLNQMYKLFLSIAIINCLFAMIGLVSYFLSNTWLRIYLQITQLERFPMHFGGVIRMTSILWNPLLFGALMALNSILAFNSIINTNKGRQLWISIFVLSSVGTILSFTRTSWLMFLLGISISLVLWGRIDVRKIFVIGGGLIIAGYILISFPINFGGYQNISDAIWGHVLATITYEDPRLDDIKTNLPRVTKYPIGYGIGTAGYAALPTRGTNSQAVFSDYIAADNNYLSIALQVGIPGLAIFILAQISSLKKILTRWKKAIETREKMILGTTIGWIIGMSIGSLFLNIWEYNLIPYLVYLLLGISLKLCDSSLRPKEYTFS